MYFLRGPAVLHHRAVRNAASETARPVKASKELYLLKRYKCHSTPVYPILDNYATHQVKYKHRLSQHNNPTNTPMTDCWWQVIPATAPPPPSLMAPQFSTGEGESWSWSSWSSWSSSKWSWSLQLRRGAIRTSHVISLVHHPDNWRPLSYSLDCPILLSKLGIFHQVATW